MSKDLEFTKQEQIVIFELARIALSDADTYDAMAEALDLSDEYLKNIQMKLESKMQEVDYFI